MKGPICCWLTSVTQAHVSHGDEGSEDSAAMSEELLRSPWGEGLRSEGRVRERASKPRLGTKDCRAIPRQLLEAGRVLGVLGQEQV